VSDAEIPDDLAAPVFRIIQEALSNVAKHSAASNVSVRLLRSGGELVLEVSDDGVGFGPERARFPAAERLGLISMRERATSTGGSFAVVSAIDIGTRIRAEWPVAPGSASGRLS
jgi:signal transduction histidine kinase